MGSVQYLVMMMRVRLMVMMVVMMLVMMTSMMQFVALFRPSGLDWTVYLHTRMISYCTFGAVSL